MIFIFVHLEMKSSPVAIWEAMSCYLPIISTDVGDLENFNKKYNFGFIIKNKSINNFKKRILFLQNKKLRESLEINQLYVFLMK